MIHFTNGNLLKSDVEALVNTVNTVGIMGKGIALMFKDAFKENYELYEAACKAGEVKVGHVFVTHRNELFGPKWIINFPTKKHWRHPTKTQWVIDGLQDLRDFISKNNIKSIAIPPLGCGNGGLDWQNVKKLLVEALSDLERVEIIVYEPTHEYQNVAKRAGVEKLTPARALIAELVRKYWVLGIECTLLEVQKLAWFLERNVEKYSKDNPVDLRFEANRYGPYATRLNHLLNALDGSYLHCDKRIADAGPLDAIWFDDKKKDVLDTYLISSEVEPYSEGLKKTAEVIDGFESPLGLELLSTVDWLIHKEKRPASLEGIKEGIRRWPFDVSAAKRKEKIFDDRLIGIALDRLSNTMSY
jgi:O-acetyl-ADP-ribose deacetylase (regulator of RNase III)